jgi:metallo-beta-lactamase class B
MMLGACARGYFEERTIKALSIVALLLSAALSLPADAQEPSRSVPTKEKLASHTNRLLLSLGAKAFKWEEPAQPIRILGPLYFVGTKGLGVFLFTTSEGHILMNTGMPSSGPMIVDAVRNLDLRPEDIKVMIIGHAHIDHAGACAYLKERFGAQLAVMKDDVALIESGGRGDFKYGDALAYQGAKVDRVLDDGDTIRMGDVLLTAYFTPGHTRGATTWVANLVVDGRTYVVAFPNGAGINPGYRLVKNASYPGIADNYRRTLDKLATLKPDIWLAEHNEFYDLEGKRRSARTEGAKAWFDPEGYGRFIAKKRRAFKAQMDAETKLPNRANH